MKILMMYRALEPLQFYGAISIVLIVVALILGAPVIVTYLETGLVPRFPTAILAASIVQLGVLSLVCGIIIHAVSATCVTLIYLPRARVEMKINSMLYLMV